MNNKKKQKILVVDDEIDLCKILKFNLEINDYKVDTAHSAEKALKLNLNNYDLILLDVMMGAVSGFDMARILKEDPATANIPIIFLTAKDTENDTVTGFNLGADDYISKPFSIREVLARVNAVIRRTQSDKAKPEQNILNFQELSMNIDKKTVYISDKRIPFTKTEFELLRLLITNPGHVFSRQELIDNVWRKDVIVLDRTVDVNITRIRKKIGRFASYIITRQGYGYYFDKQ